MMKRALKSTVAGLLGLLARGVIRRYKPRIVMITGSVGKTSTKDAVAAALGSRFYVRKSEKNFNTEFGVPYAIFGVAKDPMRNPLAWLSVFKKALALLLLPNHYANLLVLEVGAEQPGDLKKILRIAMPDAVVVTRLPGIPVHVEFYESPEAVREEEFGPAFALGPSAPLILPVDDAYARAMSKRVPARLFTYGESADASTRLSDIAFHEEDGRVDGMQARIESEGESGTIVIKGAVGRTQVLPAAAAIATASAFGITLPDALAALGEYHPPAGRTRVFEGAGGSVLIDDSYNSSPAAVEEALATLESFPHAVRRIAVLGDMLELGRYSIEEHARIGGLAAKAADVLVTVGIRSRTLADAAVAAGLSEEEVHRYDDARAAAEALPALIRTGDVILVKGSQSMRTERVSEALLADADDRLELVRQEPQWLRRR